MQEYKCRYPHLFSPLTIRGKVLKNRIVSSPHSGGPNLYRAGNNGCSSLTETAALYFGNIAKGGAAVVNTGHLGVDPRYTLGANAERFDFFSGKAIHEYQLPVMHMMTDLIHAYGSLASIELNHPGHFGDPVGDDKLLGPVDVNMGGRMTMAGGKEVKGMDEEEMHRVADYFAQAALIGKRGGFDIVNVHAGHNWLLGEFFSPIENTRTDEYGGSVENRCRFPLMVLRRIREAVGEDMIISMRFSASEHMEGGITLEEAVRSVAIMEQAADIIQCSVGMIHNEFTEGNTFPMQYMQRGCNVPFAEEIRRHVHIPIETVGGINEPEMAEQIIAEGKADLVAMARSIIADPDWANKARDGRPEDIRPCIRCLRCLNYSRRPQTGTSVCTVNPRRIIHTLLPDTGTGHTRKKVVVVGGGPAGLQAAQEIGKLGHQVVLFEKGDKLGGRLEFSEYLSFKSDIRRYRDYLIAQVEKLSNVTVRLNTDATPQLVSDQRPDAVIVAVGAEKFIPGIPGAEGSNVIHSGELFERREALGQKVIVVGGGQVGCEQTVWLQASGREVDVVEMEDQLMKENWRDTPEEHFWTEFYMTHEYDEGRTEVEHARTIDRVRIHLSTRCVEITDKGIWAENKERGRFFIQGEHVILATGLRRNEERNHRYDGLAKDVILIGDCEKVGDLLNTSSSGYYASLRI
ncbi:MAG: FAD-dependent oxidoreductase [Clostridium sp.]|nr:FAD-dependent oxidoreductase [Clostridium sp.]